MADRKIAGCVESGEPIWQMQRVAERDSLDAFQCTWQDFVILITKHERRQTRIHSSILHWHPDETLVKDCAPFETYDSLAPSQQLNSKKCFYLESISLCGETIWSSRGWAPPLVHTCAQGNPKGSFSGPGGAELNSKKPWGPKAKSGLWMELCIDCIPTEPPTPPRPEGTDPW